MNEDEPSAPSSSSGKNDTIIRNRGLSAWAAVAHEVRQALLGFRDECGGKQMGLSNSVLVLEVLPELLLTVSGERLS
jgi:hypothetical protein